MFDVSSTLKSSARPGRPRARRLRTAAGLLLLTALTLPPGGCEAPYGGIQMRRSARDYPPKPQKPCVVALGSLRGEPPPTERQIELSMFLFGTEPPPPLMLANPADVAVADQTIAICDATLGTVFQWVVGSGQGLTLPSFDPPLEQPRAVAFDKDGHRLICEPAAVVRVGPDGRETATFALPSEPFHPGDALAVGNEIWVTNVAADRIDVFAADTGRHVRTIGGRGTQPGRFVKPRGLALTPDGNVCVVDMLNDRVQVLDRSGKCVRIIGQAGDTPGCFGRPRDVAVGPDGTVFVTDAFAQRVHVFDAEGNILLTFGDPGSGTGALTLPNGIAIARAIPKTDFNPPTDPAPKYYVLVAEQLNQPGVRVYAWLGTEHVQADAAAVGQPQIAAWKPPDPARVKENPHWKSDRCTACHKQRGGALAPIAPGEVDTLCVSCHDGIGAPADPHPIGRPAQTEAVKVPEGWPTHDGQITCLTCHDLSTHCRKGARRPPGEFALLLRAYNPQRRLEYCATCHQGDVGQRFSPHRQRDASGRVREDACLFCHTKRPDIPPDGRRRFQPHLRNDTSDLCLNCHSKHWDLSPKGHVDRPVTPKIREWMLMCELSREVDASPEQLARLASQPSRRPARLPLGNRDGHEIVTCYSCHNPHYAGLFPPGSELGARATVPEDRKAALRANWVDLCSHCHHR